KEDVFGGEVHGVKLAGSGAVGEFGVGYVELPGGAFGTGLGSFFGGLLRGGDTIFLVTFILLGFFRRLFLFLFGVAGVTAAGSGEEHNDIDEGKSAFGCAFATRLSESGGSGGLGAPTTSGGRGFTSGGRRRRFGRRMESFVDAQFGAAGGGRRGA